MRRIAATALLLLLLSLPCFGETFLIVVTEIRDGEELSRPFASQEGLLEAMFDLGFVSFDTGLYAPEVDWKSMEFREPLAIARQGLAQYILAAEVRSITERIDRSSESAEGDLQPELKIHTAVRYYLFDVAQAAILGEGEIFLDNEEKQQLSYSDFLYSVGRDIAARGIDLLAGRDRARRERSQQARNGRAR